MKKLLTDSVKVEFWFLIGLLIYQFLVEALYFFNSFFLAAFLHNILAIPYLLVRWLLSVPLIGLEMTTDWELISLGNTYFGEPTLLGRLVLVVIIYFVICIILGLFQLLSRRSN